MRYRIQHTARPQMAFNARASMHIIATAVETQGTRWGARWALGFTSGARESEVLGLEWNRVDLDGATIDIAWQLQRLKQQHGCGHPDDAGAYPCRYKRVSFCPGAHWAFPAGMEWRQCERTMVFTRPKSKAGTRLAPAVSNLTIGRYRIVTKN